MQFRSLPCVAYAAHHPHSMRAPPSKTQLVHHMPRIMPNGSRYTVPFRASPCVPHATHHAAIPIITLKANATDHSQSVRASPCKTQLVYHMPRIRPNVFSCIVPCKHHFVHHMPGIMPNVIPFIILRIMCQSSPPMRACIFFQDSACVPYATHHAQRVSVHHPLPSITLCTICHATRSMRFRASSRPSITLCTECHASRPLQFRESPCVPNASHHPQRISVHHPLPSIILCTICHASCPMQFRSSPCVAYATHHPECVRAFPSMTHLVYHMPRISPNVVPWHMQRMVMTGTALGVMRGVWYTM